MHAPTGGHRQAHHGPTSGRQPLVEYPPVVSSLDETRGTIDRFSLGCNDFTPSCKRKFSKKSDAAIAASSWPKVRPVSWSSNAPVAGRSPSCGPSAPAPSRQTARTERTVIKDCLRDDVTLYQGDALSILATLPDAVMDAVLTDPPYSSGGVTLGARQADPAKRDKTPLSAHAGRCQGSAKLDHVVHAVAW